MTKNVAEDSAKPAIVRDRNAEQRPPGGRGIQPMLTVDELAALCQVPVATVYAWNAKHSGPRITRCGKYVRYRQSDVDKWLIEQAGGTAA